MCSELFPDSIAAFLADLKKSRVDKRGKRYIDRAARFATFAQQSYENESKIVQAWKTIEKCAISEDSLMKIFLTLPDEASLNPYEGVFGRRTAAPDAEKDAYIKDAQNIEKLLTRMGGSGYMRHLISDACATTNGRDAAIKFLAVNYKLFEQLSALKQLLEVVDPSAKLLTKQSTSPRAPTQNYVIQVAQLNNNLSKPKHAALAVIANANNTEVKITKEQIRKAFTRNQQTRTNCY